MKHAQSAMAAAAMAFGLTASQSVAAEPAYLDDRSSAVALVRSLYNAVNRHEYARAWGYFGESKPAADFDAFAAGYEGVDQVEIATGNVASEGAAGSVIHYVPVAIAATGEDGTEQVFAGCYVARLANPQIQREPFQPLHLERGSLKPAEGPVEEAVPARCEDGPEPQAADRVLDAAKAAFASAHGDECATPEAEGIAPENHAIAFHYQTDAEDTPQRQARLFRFACAAGAYNENHIYYLHEEEGGLREVHFATPELDIRYVDEDSESAVEAIGIVGYVAQDRLANSAFDEATLSISSHANWRGAGDASASGKWIFRNGAFTLVRYEVDASYDGAVNPETVLDYDTAP